MNKFWIIGTGLATTFALAQAPSVLDKTPYAQDINNTIRTVSQMTEDKIIIQRSIQAVDWITITETTVYPNKERSSICFKIDGKAWCVTKNGTTFTEDKNWKYTVKDPRWNTIKESVELK